MKQIIKLKVNGIEEEHAVHTHQTLLEVLRGEHKLLWRARRLRHRHVRRVHGADRRQTDKLVHSSGGPGRRQRDRHDRGIDRSRQAPSDSAGFHGSQRFSVFLLHAGIYLEHESPSGGEPKPDRRANPPLLSGKSLPLRQLLQNSGCRAGRRDAIARRRRQPGAHDIVEQHLPEK